MIIGMKMKCDFCEEEKQTFEIEIFQPFLSVGDIYNLCENCSDEMEFAYKCSLCGRYIYEYYGGIRKNIRINEETYEDECVACLQKIWLKDGMKTFKDADFFDYSDLSKAGFTKHNSYFCRAKQDYKKAEKDFNDLKSSGKKVIVNVNQSGLGLEHYISIYIK